MPFHHTDAIRPYTSAVALASIVHTVDKYLVRFGEFGGIGWYGLAYVAGFLLGWLILRWLAQSRRTPLTVVQVGDLITALIIGVLVGGRVGHVIFYQPDLLLSFRGSFPFWGLLEINRGGMSSHGGMIGVFFACLWTSRRVGQPFLVVSDPVAFVAPLGLGLGRIANWINGELPGKRLPEDMQSRPPWWSVKYPAEVLDPSFWTVQTAEKMEALSPFATTGKQLPVALFDACYAGNQAAVDALAPFLTAHYPNNFVQAATDGPILGALLVLAWWTPKRAGFVSGVFLAGYGALRLATEQFREPDPDILTLGPITLPMTLSALMIAAGVILIARALRGNAPRYGGLRPSSTGT